MTVQKQKDIKGFLSFHCNTNLQIKSIGNYVLSRLNTMPNTYIVNGKTFFVV